MPVDRDIGYPPLEELEVRWARLRGRMAESGLDAILFLQNADLIYVCGTEQAAAVLLPLEGEPTVFYPGTPGRTAQDAPWTTPLPMPAWKNLAAEISKCAPGTRTVGLELDVLPAAFYQRLREKALAGFDLSDASPLIRRVRSIKSEFEIGCIRRAADLMARVYAEAPQMFRPGMTELELEGAMLGRARSLGHQGRIRGRGFNMEMFMGHLLSGESGLVEAKLDSPTGGAGVGPGFGQGAGYRVIEAGDLISVDLCGAWGGYIADQTRLFFAGPAPAEVRDKYQALVALADDVCETMKPGASCGRVYEESFRLAEKHGLADAYMGREGSVCPFVGHAIGLELDEFPVLAGGVDEPLAEGMTFALEPRYFMEGVGVVGLEDTLVIRSYGPERLTAMSRALVELDV